MRRYGSGAVSNVPAPEQYLCLIIVAIGLCWHHSRNFVYLSWSLAGQIPGRRELRPNTGLPPVPRETPGPVKNMLPI